MTAPADDQNLLLQFRGSPYNEKVRWALDLLRLAHRRESLLPGPHMRAVKRVTGQTATPVLRLDGRWIAGSAHILDALAVRSGHPALARPADTALAALEGRFDEDWVPRVRRTVLDAALSDAGYFARLFGAGKPVRAQRIYGLIVPLAAPLIRKGTGIAGAATIEDGHRAAREALDHVAALIGPSGYLGGAAFGRADLCAAASLAPLLDLPGTPMRRPADPPAAVRALHDRYRDHPAAAWVRDLYARHRALAEDFEGASPY
jgi:glutathione S-transferase